MNPLRTHRPRRIAVYWLVAFVLAVPLLVCFKLVLSRIEGGEGWAKLLE